MKAFLLYLLSILSLTVLLISCSQIDLLDPNLISNQNNSIEQAKTWFDNYRNEPVNRKMPYSNYSAEWKRASVKRVSNNLEYIQVPIELPNGNSNMIYNPINKKFVPAPPLQLIIYKDHAKKFNIQIMELLPEGNYAEDHLGFTGDYDFTGIQILRLWTGKLIGGNRFENGKVTGIISVAMQDGRGRIGNVCEQWLRQYISTSCTDHNNIVTVKGTVLYYRLGTFPNYPQRPDYSAPASFSWCDNWVDNGPPELFQICSPDPNYDPFSPSNPSNPSDPFNPLTGSGATALLELYNNKRALFGPCPGLTNAWNQQINFTVTNQLKDKLNRLATFSPFNQGLYPSYPGLAESWYVQSIGSAAGAAVNLDNFSVFMTDLPVINGVRLSVSEFSEYVRLHFNDFVDSNLTSFQPHPLTGENENALWQSSNATGAVLLLTIPGDMGALIVGEHNTGGAQSAGWTFCTIHDPFIHDHPVSGSRTFSLYETSGGYIFSTQGADRLTNYLGVVVSGLTNGLPFNSADLLWSSFQLKMKQFIDSHQASGTILQPVTNRPNWNAVKNAVDNNQSLSTLPCN